MKEKYYKVSESQLITLIQASQDLEGLECAGVDNWCGYDEVYWEECEGVSLEDYEEVV